MKSQFWPYAVALLVAAEAFAQQPQQPQQQGKTQQGQKQQQGMAPTSAQGALDDIQKTLGFVPAFLKQLPEAALPGAWHEMKNLEMGQSTALPVKMKELIGLAVSAQIPCDYCIVAHTEFAKANGATQQEIGIAIAESALTRHWSTFLNGTQLDETKFRADLQKMTDRLKKQDTATAQGERIEVTDAQSAYKDIERTFGVVPDFMRRFPQSGIVGAWKQWRSVEVEPGPVSHKNLSLIALAVSAQIPCNYCITADTALAKAYGATEAEINEAIAMAAFTRNMSTMLNGLQVDQATFRSDVQQLVKNRGKTAQR